MGGLQKLLRRTSPPLSQQFLLASRLRASLFVFFRNVSVPSDDMVIKPMQFFFHRSIGAGMRCECFFPSAVIERGLRAQSTSFYGFSLAACSTIRNFPLPLDR